jgi:tetratricopeptide (TPR) repeat protein
MNDIDWSMYLGLPTEDIYKDSLQPMSYGGHTYKLSYAKELMYMGKMGKAYQMLAEMAPETVEDRAQRHYLLAKFFDQKGNFEKALEESRKARSLCPNEMNYRVLARNLFNRGLKERKKREQKINKIITYLSISVLIGTLGLAGAFIFRSENQSLEHIVCHE